MPQQDYDYVKFMQYDGESKDVKEVCRVYLTDGKLYWEGEQASEIKKLVHQHSIMEPYLKMDGYSLLSKLSSAFNGSYFYATDVVDKFSDVDEAVKP